MLFIDDSDKHHAYVITGSSIAEISVGGVDSTAFYVYLSSQEIGAGVSPSSNNCIFNLAHGMNSFEWAVRSAANKCTKFRVTIGFSVLSADTALPTMKEPMPV